MGYSCLSGRVFVTDCEVSARIDLSQEVTSRWEYISTHTFSVYVDSLSGNAYIEVDER